jgi:predicted nucleotidyltransferase
MDVAREVPRAIARHPAVRQVRLVGSRASGEAHELSDWDFAVETDDFGAVERDLASLAERLEPLSQQWDPYSDSACYMLMLRGPKKVDLIFPSEEREWSAAWRAAPETLEAIDRHFWDWALWLEQKRRHGRTGQVEKSLGDLFELLLAPMGVSARPGSIAEAVGSYLEARERLEGRFAVHVPRDLEREIRPVVAPDLS